MSLPTPSARWPVLFPVQGKSLISFGLLLPAGHCRGDSVPSREALPVRPGHRWRCRACPVLHLPIIASLTLVTQYFSSSIGTLAPRNLLAPQSHLRDWKTGEWSSLTVLKPPYWHTPCAVILPSSLLPPHPYKSSPISFCPAELSSPLNPQTCLFPGLCRLPTVTQGGLPNWEASEEDRARSHTNRMWFLSHSPVWWIMFFACDKMNFRDLVQSPPSPTGYSTVSTVKKCKPATLIGSL